MRSFRRRGAAARRPEAALKPRWGVRASLALLASLVVVLAGAISAGSAYASYGTTGTTEITTPDTSPEGYNQANGYSAPANDGLGVPAGAIKHVWVIVEENHAYESNFTGLEGSGTNYLSQQLPAAGAELTHYYGTGHSSLDNYLSMVSGQAPVTDDQGDCGTDGYTALAGSVNTSGSLATNGNYGQLVSAAGANAPAGDNGCVYPSTVPTLFNQLDAASKSWKVYAQDLNNTGATGQNAGDQYCGASDATVGATPQPGQTANPVSTYPVDSSATLADQYVSKHNPLPWFESILGSGDCTSTHLGQVFNGTNTSGVSNTSGDSLYSDLQSESTTPDFSYIVPNNCSNGHDAVCAGNNLSGMATGANTAASEGTPINNVGGSYAENLFLEHVIPEIMSSPAYADGGLIAVVWDEAYPQFTYSSDSFVDSTVSTASAQNSLQNDSAGETLFGKSLNWEPSGPNVPNVQSQSGQQLSAGPGFNEYLHRPSATSAAGTDLVGCTGGVADGAGFSTVTTGGCYTGGGSAGTAGGLSVTASIATSGLATQGGVSAGSDVSPNDEGEELTTIPAGATFPSDGNNGDVYIGQVTSTLPAALSASGTDTTGADQDPVVQFQLVDNEGNPVTFSSALTGQTIATGGETTADDPLYDAYDPATGGGDTGAILLSPYIAGGTVSNTYYNHYSLLRSLEDIFDVSAGSGSAPGYTGSINVSTGLDGDGHLGYAAQPGLAPFGTDVFTASPFDTTTDTDTVTTGSTVTSTKTVIQTVTDTIGQYIQEPGSTKDVLTSVVPNVKAKTKASAEEILGYAGFKYKLTGSTKTKTGYEQIVKSQSPAAKKEEKRSTTVTLTLAYKKV